METLSVGGKLPFIGDLDGRALSVRPDATSTSGTSRVNAQIVFLMFQT